MFDLLALPFENEDDGRMDGWKTTLKKVASPAFAKGNRREGAGHEWGSPATNKGEPRTDWTTIDRVKHLCLANPLAFIQ